jgi:hypothetical protein
LFFFSDTVVVVAASFSVSEDPQESKARLVAKVIISFFIE